jgi:hypothetical protein
LRSGRRGGVTRTGAAASGTGLAAPRGAPWPGPWYRHHLAVADVAEALTALGVRWHGGAPAWETEAEWSREARATGGLRPDGVLVLTAPDGAARRMAVEVELHPKPPRRYPPKLAWYRERLAAGAFQRVRWYCADAPTLRQVLAAVRAAGAAGDGVDVCPLPERK